MAECGCEHAVESVQHLIAIRFGEALHHCTITNRLFDVQDQMERMFRCDFDCLVDFDELLLPDNPVGSSKFQVQNEQMRARA